MSYSPKNPKISIYVDGYYKVSTNWSATNRDAIRRYAEKHNICDSRVKARRE
jgi:hypothetical protein